MFTAPLFTAAVLSQAPVLPAPAPAPLVDSAPAARPSAPRWKGAGLIATTGLFGAAGLGFNIARVAVGSRLCDDLRYDEASGSVEGFDRCFNAGLAMGGLATGALVTNGLAFGLSAGAGVVHGRHAAHRARFAGRREARARLQVGLGAGMLGVGLVGYLAVRVSSWFDVLGQQTCSARYPLDNFADPATRANVNPFARCMGDRVGGYLSGILVAQAMSTVGVGLLTHGVAYRRERRLLGYIASGRLRLQPSLGREHVGLALAGRF
jgi:hypothetical protein